MKLHEIIETVKHDRDYFEGAETEFQSGRAWEAGKILDMLYKLETAQLQQHGVMQAEGSESVSEAAVGNSAVGQSGRDGFKECPLCGTKYGHSFNCSLNV